MSTFEGLRDDLFLVTTFIGDNIAGYIKAPRYDINIAKNISYCPAIVCAYALSILLRDTVSLVLSAHIITNTLQLLRSSKIARSHETTVCITAKLENRNRKPDKFDCLNTDLYLHCKFRRLVFSGFRDSAPDTHVQTDYHIPAWLHPPRHNYTNGTAFLKISIQTNILKVLVRDKLIAVDLHLHVPT